jgi:hypothetical protein
MGALLFVLDKVRSGGTRAGITGKEDVKEEHVYRNY